MTIPPLLQLVAVNREDNLRTEYIPIGSPLHTKSPLRAWTGSGLRPIRGLVCLVDPDTISLADVGNVSFMDRPVFFSSRFPPHNTSAPVTVELSHSPVFGYISGLLLL